MARWLGSSSKQAWLPTLESRLGPGLFPKSLWYAFQGNVMDNVLIMRQYLIANLGMSRNFGFVDVDHLTFPATMKVDYIRVYQNLDMKNIGCDPEDFPTAAYINEYVA